MLLEGRIVGEQNIQGYWEARDKYLLMLEQVHNEPTDQSVRTLLDRFWESWQDLSTRPTETGARRAVLERGNALAEGINDRYRRFKAVRDMIEGDIKGTVEQVNSLTTEIAALSGEILKSEALGDNPNDLLDRRDLLVGKLSTLIDVTVSYQDEDELVVSTGGMHLVQGRHHEELALEPDPNDEGYGKLVWADGGDPVTLRGGTLASLVELRDVDTKGEIQALDLLSQNFVDLVNEVHRRGFGLDGSTGADFFVQHPFIDNAQGNYDANGDGAFDATYVFRVTGANTLTATDQVGLRGTLTPARDRRRRHGGLLPDRHRARPRGAHQPLGRRGRGAPEQRGPAFDLGRARGRRAQPRLRAARPRRTRASSWSATRASSTQSGPAGAYAWTRADAVDALAADGGRLLRGAARAPLGVDRGQPELADDPNAIAAAAALDGRSAGPGRRGERAGHRAAQDRARRARRDDQLRQLLRRPGGVASACAARRPPAASTR